MHFCMALVLLVIRKERNLLAQSHNRLLIIRLNAIMHKFNWDYIRYFLAVVAHGSATQAAVMLGVNQSTVSRRLTSLEEELGARLFERSTSRGWILTAAGERILEAADSMSNDAHQIERMVMKNNAEMKGLIRVTTADLPNMDLLLDVIDTFCKKYPEIDMHLTSTNELLDLSIGDADVAIRATNKPPQNLVGKRIGKIKFSVYATRDLVEAYERGERDMTCITWDHETQSPDWIHSNLPDCKLIRVNSAKIAFEMAKRGMGLVLYACAWGDMSSKLYRVPVENVGDGPDLWVLTHVDVRTTARVRRFRDAVVAALESSLDKFEGRMIIERPLPKLISG